MPSYQETQAQTDEQREASLNDFMSYVDTLLSFKKNCFTHDVIRPPSPIPSPRVSTVSNSQAIKSSFRQSVDLAVQRNSISAYGSTLNSVFEIARNKKKIASLSLSKPVYKLGETIVFLIDFSWSVLPCYHVSGFR